MLATEQMPSVLDEKKMGISTPYYLIDEKKLIKNLERIAKVRKESGSKAVLALKCFSTWSTFDLMRPYLDGTTSSSLFEARLGYEKFGKEVHAYSVAYSDEEFSSVRAFASKIIFNSASQLKRYLPLVGQIPVGLRINPGVSHSNFDLADPARRYSRLGIVDKNEAFAMAPYISGAMFHCQCENASLESFTRILDSIAAQYGPLLEKLEWVSLGGGIYFTKDDYPLEAFIKKLGEFSKAFNVQVYLEPGESVVTGAGSLVTRVLDVVHNEIDVAIIDSAVETHMSDLMIYETPAKIEEATETGVPTMIAGRTCLAGDVFGTYHFPNALKVGDTITIADAAGYTMVKKNWFNGVQMPSIAIRKTDGQIQVVRQFGYSDFLSCLS